MRVVSRQHSPWRDLPRIAPKDPFSPGLSDEATFRNPARVLSVVVVSSSGQAANGNQQKLKLEHKISHSVFYQWSCPVVFGWVAPISINPMEV